MTNKEWFSTLSAKEFVDAVNTFVDDCDYCVQVQDNGRCLKVGQPCDCQKEQMKWLEKEHKETPKPCPFCGSVDALRVMREDEINPELEEVTHAPHDYAVCCDFTKGGCGATGTYRPSKSGAIERWNRRA